MYYFVPKWHPWHGGRAWAAANLPSTGHLTNAPRHGVPAPVADPGYHVPLPVAPQRIANPRRRQPTRDASPLIHAPPRTVGAARGGSQAKGPRPWDHPPPDTLWVPATADDPTPREPISSPFSATSPATSCVFAHRVVTCTMGIGKNMVRTAVSVEGEHP
jgi:hypothetical protein